MVGQMLGRFELLRLIGEGGMGAVYEARDTKMGRHVALKIMSPTLVANAEAVVRFEREASSLAMLQHPNIVTIHDSFEDRGHFCLVMELVDGEPLDAIIRKRYRIEVDRKLRMMVSVCKALDYAHGRGVVHRDLKPSNILMLPDESPKIVDFGIAKLMGDNITRTRSQLGTIAYMSPEQFHGKPVDRRTDIFAAGTVLYEFLSGISPFDGETTAICMKKLILDPTPKLPPEVTGIPQDLHAVIEKSLAKEPEQRYTTAAEFAAAIERVITEMHGGTMRKPPLTVIEPLPPRPPQPGPLPPVTPPQLVRTAESPKGARSSVGIVVGVLLVLAVIFGVIGLANRSKPDGGSSSSTGPTTPVQQASAQGSAPAVKPRPVPVEPVSSGTSGDAGASGLTDTQPASTTSFPNISTNERTREIDAAVEAWREAMVANDPDRLAALYANNISRYFLQTDVTRSYVLNYLRQSKASGDGTLSLSLGPIKQTPGADGSVRVDFVESFEDIRNGYRSQHTVNTILDYWFEDGAWKIRYERQLN